jgi:methylthioribulose-1-phosphate dehydratase
MRVGGVVSDQVLNQLALEASRLSNLGFLACTASNVSGLLEKNPLVVGMSPSGVDKGQLKPADFIRIDGQARPMSPDQRKPSDEALLHARLYQAVGCLAVCHGHPPHAVAMSMAAGPHLVVAGIEMQKAFAGISTHHGEQRIPIVDNSQDMEELATWVMAARQPQIPAILVRGHGVYAWGNNVKEASRHLETVEWLARLVWLCRTAGISS